MLDQLLTNEQKKALEKHFNDPKTKARHKRMDRLLARLKVKRLEQEMLDKEQEEKNARRMIWAVIIVVILAFHLAG